MNGFILIGDCVDASIQKLEKYTKKKSKEKWCKPIITTAIEEQTEKQQKKTLKHKWKEK